MEECVKLQNVDITQEFYLDNHDKTETSTGASSKVDSRLLKTSPVIIDVEKYIDPTCCFKLVGIEAKENDKRKLVSISDDGKKILYYPKLSVKDKSGVSKSNDVESATGSKLWHCEGKDSFTYCAHDLKTGGHFEGTVTLIGIEKPEDFAAANICINLQKLKSDTVQIDVSLFNKYEGVFITEIGAFNKKYIKDITIDPLNRAKLIIRLNLDCSDWDCCGSGADFTYKIGVTDYTYGGITSIGRIGLRKCDDPFIARNIVEEVWEPVPTSIQINVEDYYDEADIYENVEVSELSGLIEERGSATISPDGRSVTYTFNKTSGFWDGNHAQDVFQYTLKNPSTGKTACAYIIIRKCEMQSGSGSGSGSGGNTTLYFAASGGVTIQLSDMAAGPPVSEDGNLTSINPIVFKDMPGTHSISGGRVRLIKIGEGLAMFYYKIIIISGTPTVNAVAPVIEMELFISCPPISGSVINAAILEENPFSSSQVSYLIIG